MSYRIYKSKYTGQEIDDLLGQVSSKVDDSMLGAAGGVATLDTSGKIPSQQMPEHIAYTNKDNTFTEPQTFDYTDTTGSSIRHEYAEIGAASAHYYCTEENTDGTSESGEAFISSLVGRISVHRSTTDDSGTFKRSLTLDVNKNWIARNELTRERIDGELGTPVQTYYAYKFPKTYPNKEVTLATIEDLTAQLDTKLDKAGGTISGSLIIAENLTVQGKTTSVDTQNLKVADKLIYVAKDNTIALTSPAGLITPKYDGTNNGGIVYDHTGTAYVGDITLDSNGNVDVNNSDLQPIATRNATITNNNLVKWDSGNHKLVDSGKKVDDLSTATNLENGTGLDSLVQKYSGEVDATHFGNTCDGESGAVFGEANFNSGNRTLISGKMNRSSAPNSLIIGLGNGRGIGADPTIDVLSGEQLFVFGSLNRVSNGNGNVVLGAENTLFDVRYTTIIGRGNIIDNTSLYEGKCVVGRFNNQKPDTMFEVGVGDYNNRLNGFEVLKDGRAKVQTAPKDNTDVVRKLELDTKFDKAGGTVTGDMVVGGNFTVQGKTTTVDSETLRVTDKLIEVGKGNTAPLTSPAGLITPKYDGTNNGGIVYDHTGTAYVGDITLDSNGNVDVNNSDLQPIATRNDTITDGNIVKWDGTNHKLVDAGKNVDSFVDKLPASLRSQAYVRNANGEDTGLAYTYTNEGNTLALRNASGQLQVSDPSQGKDAANKSYADNLNARYVSTSILGG